MTDIVEQAARVTDGLLYGPEALVRPKGRDIAQALADAGLLAQPAHTVPTRDVYELAIERIGTGETWTVDAREALGLTRTVPTRKQIAEAVSDIDAKSWPNPASTEEIADVIHALLADQPTVAEVKAQALEEFAAHIENTAQRDDVRLTEHAVNDTGGAYLARERAQQIRDGE